MKLTIDNDFQQKVMTQSFTEPFVITTPEDVQLWRAQWMAALGSWHSPYKAIVDCSNLTVSETQEVKKALDVMLRFFNGFFLRKVVGFGHDAAKGHAALPFPIVASEEDAAVEAGVRQPKTREPTDFRSSIQLQNHFQQHTVEMSFSVPVVITGKDQVQTLKSKLMNNLMQWHSKWNLLIDCANLEIAADANAEFQRMLSAMRGFFLKQTVGYSPRVAKESYPFDVQRVRHRAAAIIEGEGNFSGDKADCKSRKA